jgi:hypothetical protein
MYFNYSFLLSHFYNNGFIPDLLESSSVIVPVNKSIWEEKAYFFQKLYNTSTPFCFGFFQADQEWGNTELSNVRDSLSLFFFLPNYAKKAGAYLLLSDLDAQSDKNMMSDLEQLLETQGITPLSKNYTVKNGDITKFNQYYYYSTDLIDAFNNESQNIDFSVLFKKLVAENGANKQIVIAIKDEEDFHKKISVIKKFEQWVSDNEKAYADLLSVFIRTNDEYLKLKIENDKLRFRLDNYSDYLKALRKIASRYVNDYHRTAGEPQITGPSGTNVPPATFNTSSVHQELNLLRRSREEILQWYTKEYEVLPLWYKRFGHVIKMATGKKKITEYLHRQKKT